MNPLDALLRVIIFSTLALVASGFALSLNNGGSNDTSGVLLLACKYLGLLVTAISGTYGAINDPNDKRKTTATLAGVFIGAVISIGSQALETHESQKKDDETKKQAQDLLRTAQRVLDPMKTFHVKVTLIFQCDRSERSTQIYLDRLNAGIKKFKADPAYKRPYAQDTGTETLYFDSEGVLVWISISPQSGLYPTKDERVPYGVLSTQLLEFSISPKNQPYKFIPFEPELALDAHVVKNHFVANIELNGKRLFYVPNADHIVVQDSDVAVDPDRGMGFLAMPDLAGRILRIKVASPIPLRLMKASETLKAYSRLHLRDAMIVFSGDRIVSFDVKSPEQSDERGNHFYERVLPDMAMQ